jgi:hypothetical protein
MMHLQKRPLGKAGRTNGADNLGFLQELISNATSKILLTFALTLAFGLQ